MKKLIFALWIISGIFFVGFTINYKSNEKFIEKYNNGTYDDKSTSILGFTEPYIDPYNRGNSYSKRGQYEEAINCYDKALKKNPPQGKDCKIRYNKVINMLAIFSNDIKDEENKPEKEEAIARLREMQNVLTEKGCANAEGTGHDKDCQELYDGIEELIQGLENGFSAQQPSDSDPQPEIPPEGNPVEKTKEDKLKDLQDEGQKERGGTDRKDEYFTDWDFEYDGETW